MYCINCGNKVDDGAKFCSNCGATVRVSSQAQPLNQPTYTASRNEMPKPTYIPPNNIKPKSKAPAVIISLIAALILIGFVVGYVAILYFVATESAPGLSVTDVKTSYITNLDEENSIGEVFEDYSYFDDTEWSTYEQSYMGKNSNFVRFDAEIAPCDDCDSYDDISIAFYYNEDMADDEFKIHSISINGEEISDLECEKLIRCIYNDEVFEYMGGELV